MPKKIKENVSSLGMRVCVRCAKKDKGKRLLAMVCACVCDVPRKIKENISSLSYGMRVSAKSGKYGVWVSKVSKVFKVSKVSKVQGLNTKRVL